MFYVGGSFIFKVLEGHRIDEFGDKFLNGSKVRFGEALLGILMILGCPVESQIPQFGRKKTLFLRFEIWTINGVKKQSILGGGRRQGRAHGMHSMPLRNALNVEVCIFCPSVLITPCHP